MFTKLYKYSICFLLFLIILSCQSFAEKVISWKDASNHYGEILTVDGIIVGSYNSGKACFLNFHEDYKNNFVAVIFASDYYLFPSNPEDYYLNKHVQITGLIKKYQGKPEIIIKSKAQIKIIAEKTEKEMPKIISWEDADQYYGKIMIVEGTIVGTHNTGKVCFLNFHKNWKRYFAAVIFASNYHKFSESPESLFIGKKVQITGLIKKYQGKPEIIISSPDQIKIIK
jgi:hypothetical protein